MGRESSSTVVANRGTAWRLAVLGALIFVTVCFPPVGGPVGMPHLRLEELAIFFVAPAVLLLTGWIPGDRVTLRVGGALCLWVVVIGVSIATSWVAHRTEPAARDLFDIVKILKLGLLFVTVRALCANLDRVRRVAFVMVVWAGVAAALVALFQYFQFVGAAGAAGAVQLFAPIYSSEQQLLVRAVGTGVNPNMGAQVMVICLALGLSAWRTGGVRIWGLGASLVLTAAILVTGSRSGLIMAALVWCVVLVWPKSKIDAMGDTRWSENRGRRLIGVAALVGGPLLLINLGVYSSYLGVEALSQMEPGEILEMVYDVSMAARVEEIWPRAVQWWSDAPIVGWGPASGAEMEVWLDSEYLTVLVHYGLAGVCAVGALYWGLWSAARGRGDALGIGFRVAVLGLLVGGLVHVVLFDPQTANLLMIVAAMVPGHSWPEQHGAR